MTPSARITSIVTALDELLEPAAFEDHHLPLGAYPEVGNNAILANKLGCDRDVRRARAG
jgi:hypothetical protein